MDATDAALGDAELAGLLERTSRTFALTIPLLPAPLARQVGLAYLLFRVADTLEDATLWPRDRRLAALEAFATWLEGAGDGAWIEAARATPPVAHDGYLALLARAPAVRAATERLDDAPREAIRAGVLATARRMHGFVARQDEAGALELRDLDDLRAYCYAVAGIVGEMLTALFVLAEPDLAAVRGRLDAGAAAFGEALQLVNILKDAASDAREGRLYVPEAIPREAVEALARADVARGRVYLDALREGGASKGVRAFCALPLRLAEATLDRLREGAKLTREEVMQLARDAVDAA